MVHKLAPRRRYERVRIRSASGAMLEPKEEFREILQHFRAAFDGPELACKVDCVPIVFEVDELNIRQYTASKATKQFPQLAFPQRSGDSAQKSTHADWLTSSQCILCTIAPAATEGC